jgi:hypothetical protein
MGLHRLFLTSSHADRFPLGAGRTDMLEFDIHPIAAEANEIMLARLESASIPMTRHTIHDANNIAYLNNFFTGKSLSFTYDATTAKLAVSSSNANPITIFGAALGSTAAGLLGLGSETLVLAANANSVPLPSCIDLTSARAIIVASEGLEVNSADSISLTSHNASSSNILIAIPVEVPFGSVQHFQDQTGTMLSVNRKTISTIKLQLLDEQQRPLDLNGASWSCVLNIQAV